MFSERALWAAHSVVYAITVNTNIFLLYMIERFIRKSKPAEFRCVKDPILGHKVPNIVLL